MDDNKVDYDKLENLIDSWIPQMLNRKIPRYSFIFHCNCACVDVIIECGGNYRHYQWRKIGAGEREKVYAYFSEVIQ